MIRVRIFSQPESPAKNKQVESSGGSLILGQAIRKENPLLTGAHLYDELWISLASLLRAYTAAHGLHVNSQAEIEHDREEIHARNGKNFLKLARNHAIVTWTRDNGTMGTLELTQAGTLRGPAGEEAMDLAAEQWARELMQEAEGTR